MVSALISTSTYPATLIPGQRSFPFSDDYCIKWLESVSAANDLQPKV
ncbi:hypothetical protein HMPREF0454_00584 [Hafnia alvei ATCC 51873]|uniref:Uncharacterized protein n=1 Tax=Hafnia alvei ATCC 51873 TaxID=1002364 RepID=G9Y1X4_HAFAL|nr:hypothetical protein HMPREF0454_00584 [Hafnia alvei ATCC 51873]